MVTQLLGKIMPPFVGQGKLVDIDVDVAPHCHQEVIARKVTLVISMHHNQCSTTRVNLAGGYAPTFDNLYIAFGLEILHDNGRTIRIILSKTSESFKDGHFYIQRGMGLGPSQWDRHQLQASDWAISQS